MMHFFVGFWYDCNLDVCRMVVYWKTFHHYHWLMLFHMIISLIKAPCHQDKTVCQSSPPSSAVKILFKVKVLLLTIFSIFIHLPVYLVHVELSQGNHM